MLEKRCANASTDEAAVGGAREGRAGEESGIADKVAAVGTRSVLLASCG